MILKLSYGTLLKLLESPSNQNKGKINDMLFTVNK